MLSRAFLLASAALAIVMLVEELPAELRGGGIGLLQILGGIGFGCGAGLYAAVDLLPLGWRALYAFGVVPLLLLPFFRRALRETRRFEAEPRGPDGSRAPGWIRPLVELARTHPRRAAAIGMAGAFSAMGGIAFFQYTSWFVRTVHGWAPRHYALLVLGGGLIGVLGNVVGGRGSDRFGRRRIGFGGLLLLPLFVALFALGPAETLVVAWGLVVLCSSAAGIVLRALATELFPTSHRATAGGWLVLVETLGWSLGLLLVGVFADSAEDLPRLVALLALASLPAAGFLLLVPETHRRELEELQQERA
jgi:MFS family permease